MKTEPEQHANDLIEKYYNMLPQWVNKNDATLCAIIDVNNTIEALDECSAMYFKQVLTILESKL